MADLSFCGFTLPSGTSHKYLTSRKHRPMHRNGLYSDLHESNTAWWLGMPQFLRQWLDMTETLLMDRKAQRKICCISEASSFTDFQSILQCLLTYESTVPPLHTHSQNKPSQIIPSTTQSPIVAHHPLIHTMTSSTLHSILKFSCLSWRWLTGGRRGSCWPSQPIFCHEKLIFLWNIRPAKV